MSATSFPLVFDGHNDTLLDLAEAHGRRGGTSSTPSETGHIDFPRAQEGGLGGGFFACYVPSPRPEGMGDDPAALMARFRDPDYRPATPDFEASTRKVMSMMAELFDIEGRGAGRVQIVRTADELAACLANGVFAAILHIEGAEAIDTDLDALHVYYKAGLALASARCGAAPTPSRRACRSPSGGRRTPGRG